MDGHFWMICVKFSSGSSVNKMDDTRKYYIGDFNILLSVKLLNNTCVFSISFIFSFVRKFDKQFSSGRPRYEFKLLACITHS